MPTWWTDFRRNVKRLSCKFQFSGAVDPQFLNIGQLGSSEEFYTSNDGISSFILSRVSIRKTRGIVVDQMQKLFPSPSRGFSDFAFSTNCVNVNPASKAFSTVSIASTPDVVSF